MLKSLPTNLQEFLSLERIEEYFHLDDRFMYSYQEAARFFSFWIFHEFFAWFEEITAHLETERDRYFFKLTFNFLG